MTDTPEGIPENAKNIYIYNTYFYKDEDWDRNFSEDYLKEKKGFTLAEFRKEVSSLISLRDSYDEINTDVLENLLKQNPDMLKIILIVLDISDEYFKRVITFLRNEGEESEWMTFESSSEWSLDQIKNKIEKNSEFRKDICELFIRGRENPLLKEYLPEWHITKFSKENLFFETEGIIDRLVKSHLDGSRNAKKGDIPEIKIEKKLEKEGIPFHRGEKKLGLFEDDDDNDEPQWDFFIPKETDPKIVVEVSFEQTTASGMNRKMRDISSANSELKSRESFSDVSVVAFIDGVGWIARGKSALESWGNSVDEIFTTHPEELNRFAEFVKKKLRELDIPVSKQTALDV